MMLRKVMVICVLGWTGGICSTETASDLPIHHLTRTQGPHDGMGAHHEREVSDPAELIDYKSQLVCKEQIYLATFYPELVALGRYAYGNVLPKNIPFLDDTPMAMAPCVSPEGAPFVVATCEGLRKHKVYLEGLLLQDPDLELVLNLGKTQWHEWMEETCRQIEHINNEFKLLFQGVGAIEGIYRDLPSPVEELPGKVFSFEESDFPGALRNLHLTNASGKKFFYQFHFDGGRFNSLKLHPLVKEYIPESVAP